MHTKSTSSAGQEGVDIVGARDFSSGPGPEIMAADTLEGDTVVNRQGETLGEIKHIMIDVPRGRVAYAVLSFGGILGVGDKLFAIPWSAFTLDAGNHNFILDVPEQRLRMHVDSTKTIGLRWPTKAGRTRFMPITMLARIGGSNRLAPCLDIQ